jgi:hypothetical protein
MAGTGKSLLIGVHIPLDMSSIATFQMAVRCTFLPSSFFLLPSRPRGTDFARIWTAKF